jgi:hypothetical protein
MAPARTGLLLLLPPPPPLADFRMVKSMSMYLPKRLELSFRRV